MLCYGKPQHQKEKKKKITLEPHALLARRVSLTLSRPLLGHKSDVSSKTFLNHFQRKPPAVFAADSFRRLARRATQLYDSQETASCCRQPDASFDALWSQCVARRRQCLANMKLFLSRLDCQLVWSPIQVRLRVRGGRTNGKSDQCHASLLT